MEVYNQIKKDLWWWLGYFIIFYTIINTFNIGIDDTDKDGWNRSGVRLITDYGTGTQYLYRNGALIKREKHEVQHE